MASKPTTGYMLRRANGLPAPGFYRCEDEARAALGRYPGATVLKVLVTPYGSDRDCCVWYEEEDGGWHTDCLKAFEFGTGGPLGNGFVCCPYCGNPVRECPWQDPAGEDDDAE